MCNCVICSRPCQSNAESAGMPCLETLVTRPDASNHLSHVTWVFRITLRSSVSKHLRFGILTPCRNVSFVSAIPSLHLVWIIACVPGLSLCLALLDIVRRSSTHACPMITLVSCPCHICLLLFDPACVLTMFINKSLHMDPYASRLVGSVTTTNCKLEQRKQE